MAGTKEGGIAARNTNKEKYGKDFYIITGRMGGLKRTDNTKLKGYGTNRELARESGRRGGTISKRSKVIK